MNFEFGISRDPNIAATIIGIAVKNPTTGNWYTFDVEKNKLKNVANFKIGIFPIFLIPTRKLRVGNLIKKDGSYYYVKAIDSEGITVLNACSGIIQKIIPERGMILKKIIYTKVVSLNFKFNIDK